MTPEGISELIESQLPDAQARVVSDDNTHFEAIVISSAFDGARALKRHQMVYACLGERMGGDIHALSIRAYTPAEWAQRDGE
ncbi:MAG: BolA/IbaG family iron-sulfur metabolism protein [Pseudomonadota bacterium]